MAAGDGAGPRFRLLGELDVVRDGRSVDVGTARQRAVLAALLVDANRAVPTAALVERVWGTAPLPSRPVNAVQTYLSLLRRALGGVAITRRAGGYVLSVDPDRIDLHEFRRLTAQARAERDDHRTVALLEQALALWRGPAFDALDTPWFSSIRATVANQRLAAELDLVDAQLRLSRHAEVLAALEERAERHPLDERLAGQLMLALYRSGRQADAFARYQRIRARLADELGNDPGPELQRLHHQILTADPAVNPPGTTAPRRVPRELPAPPANFTGRDGELAELDAAFTRASDAGTVIISAIGGTAGVGKTALALRWAHQHRDRFPDGQLFLNLRGYDPRRPVHPGDALVRLLGSLGVAAEEIPDDLEDRAARYRSAIAGKRVLLVLDNVATTEQVAPLLPGSASGLVLATSRDSLAGLVALHGAPRLDLDVLAVPDAVALLRSLIGERVATDPAAAAALAERCARLPLALRVVAERAALRPEVPLTALAAELAEHQLDVLDAGGEPRAAVRAAFSWSYRHLPDETARVFRLLGLHPGPTMDTYAVGALTGLGLRRAEQAIDSLVRAHLVQRVGADRLTMHDLLRSYARELADEPAALPRLFDFYVAASAAAMDRLHAAERRNRPAVTPPGAPVPPMADAAAARAWLDAERPTLVEVVVHAEAATAVLLSNTLYRYLEGGHYADAVTVHEHALHAARAGGDRHGEATTSTNLGAVHRLLSRYDSARQHLTRAGVLFTEQGDSLGQARVLSNLGVVDDRTGRLDSAVSHCREALTRYRAAGDRHGEACTLTNLSAVEDQSDRRPEAARHQREALALFQELGDPWGEAVALANLGDLAGRAGEVDAAAAHLGAALDRFHELGHRYGQAVTLSNLGDLHTRLGDHKAAVGHHEQALLLYRELGHRYGEVTALNGIGEALAASGDNEGADAGFRAALALAIETGDRDERLRAEAGLELRGKAPRSVS